RTLNIVCTTAMVADLARRVGGEHVAVTALMGAGVDPHLYKATSSDVARLSRADLILYSGLHLEGKMGEVFSRLARKKPVVAVTDGLNRERLLQVGGEQYDPHVWFDVSLWSGTVPTVERALAKLDPGHADDYRSNAEHYRAELVKLDRECSEQIALVAKARRVLVTAHDAFHYFGRAYEIEVQAIQGISTQSEAAISKINELVELLSQRGVKAVFVETSVSERNIRALVEGCAARGHRVEIGGQLYSDAMGPAGTSEGTYVGMVRYNVATITRALQ
ncbi:MAG: metal ABC transporter solute-binding protein, Zn/Mn family, partial [Candidatus Saccharimonadales bacterium]